MAKEEIISDDLNKAAEEYATEFVEPFELYYTKDEVRQFEAQHEDSFKAGAQWQKQKMLKNAIETSLSSGLKEDYGINYKYKAYIVVEREEE